MNRLEYGKIWAQLTTTVSNKIQIVLECVPKNNNIGCSHFIVLKTCLSNSNGSKRFDEETMCIRLLQSKESESCAMYATRVCEEICVIAPSRGLAVTAAWHYIKYIDTMYNNSEIILWFHLPWYYSRSCHCSQTVNSQL